MIRRVQVFLLLATCGLSTITTTAQDEPILVSPEVRPDRTIVFRYWAPKANDVQLTRAAEGIPGFDQRSVRR